MKSLPLNGVRVVAIGDLLATKVCSQLLRDLGASVANFAHIPEHVDVVIGDRASLAAQLNDNCLQPAAVRLAQKYSSIACVLEFTHSARVHEQDTHVPCERTAASQAGLYESLVPFAQPQVFCQPVCSFAAGLYGAYSVVLALIERLQGKQEPAAVAVPLLGAAYSLLGLQGLFAFDYPLNWKPVRWMAAPFKEMWRTRDGTYIYLHVGLAQHLRKFLDVLQEHGHAADALEIRRNVHQHTLNDPVEPQGYVATAKVVCALRKLFLSRDGAYWEHLLSSAGLCCIRVRSYQEWCASDWAMQGGFVKTNEHGSSVVGNVITVDTRHSEKVAHQSGLRKGMPLEGLRVLDFSQVIAGPLAGRTLAEYGADVLRIENPHMNQSFVEPFAAAFHAGKKKIVVDMRLAEGKAEVARLLNEWRPEVVLHNFARGVPEKLGISEEQIRACIPDVIYLDINAFGDKGPLSGLPGFEQTAQALAGVAQDSMRNGTPKMFMLPVHDMGAGLMGAVAVAAGQYQRLATGKGCRVHTSLVAASMLLQMAHPNQVSTEEFAGPISRAPKFRKLFAHLRENRHWMLTWARVSSGSTVPIVRAPIHNLEWQNSLQLVEGYSPALQSKWMRTKAAAAEIGWGVWWVIRNVLVK